MPPPSSTDSVPLRRKMSSDPVPEYRKILGQVEGLQRGFTTGTCALAAAKGALLLLKGEIPAEREEAVVEVTVKKDLCLPLPVIGLSLQDGTAHCAIVKDSGDDDDITHGKLFCAAVSWEEEGTFIIEGGPGIGRITREGLPLKPGEWAINPGPRRMIRKNLESLLPSGRGIRISLSVPEGGELARQTWNPRIGIEGGISIIGTSGVIEPRSAAAYKASIALLIKSRRAAGEKALYITPGYVGAGFYSASMCLEDEQIIRFGDYAGFSLSHGAAKGYEEVHLAAHIGKMAKIAAGLFDTHCKTGDARLETVAALAGAAGASPELIRRLLDLKMAEEAVPLIAESGLQDCYNMMVRRTADRIHALWQKNYDRLPELSLYILDLKGNQLNTIIRSR